MMTCPVTPHLKSPARVLQGAVLVSALALSAAFASEAFLGLEPCPLCILQRWPYALVIVLGLIGLALRHKAPSLPRIMVGLTGLTFLGNSGIALYHSGIERHWWASALEGCIVPNFGDTPKSILENIMSAPAGRCDEIPWADPILGLSMANDNVLLCFGLFILCAVSVWKSRNPQQR